MDVVSDGVLDVAFGSDRPAPALNIVHPRPISWASAMSYLAESLEDIGQGKISLVPFDVWYKELERRAENAEEEDVQNIVCPITD